MADQWALPISEVQRGHVEVWLDRAHGEALEDVAARMGLSPAYLSGLVARARRDLGPDEIPYDRARATKPTDATPSWGDQLFIDEVALLQEQRPGIARRELAERMGCHLRMVERVSMRTRHIEGVARW